jgi:hypothetical protein
MYSADTTSGTYLVNTAATMPTAIDTYLNPVPKDPTTPTPTCPLTGTNTGYCALANNAAGTKSIFAITRFWKNRLTASFMWWHRTRGRF